MSDSLNFNLKLYRERLADKYSKSPIDARFDTSTSYIGNQRKTPTKKEYQHAPTLDNLVNKLHDYSSKKSKQNDSFLFKSGKGNQNSSPSKINGMHQKIQSISSVSPPPSQHLLGFPARGHHQNSVSQFNGLYSPTQQSSFIGSPNHYQAITERPDSQQKRAESTIELSSLIPLHEIVNMRSKLENANINIATITPTYLTEFVKLANVISSKLKVNKK